jgi:GNAT superfamily N-acetyltransferase
MGIDIRQATPSDAQEACDLLRRSIEEGCAADHGRRTEILQAWLSNKTVQNVTTWFSAPGNYAVVALQGGELAGMALLTQAGKLALCYVMPGQLRQGIGSAMVDAIEARARCWDIAKLHMHFEQRLLRTPRLCQCRQGQGLLRPRVRLPVEAAGCRRAAGQQAVLQLQR